jgi:hypothetical protein
VDGFCSEISLSPPEGFIPAAMELFHIEKETGKGYSEIASEVEELYSQREKLTIEVGDLKAKEDRAKELKGEVEENEEKVQKLRLQREQLEELKDFLNDPKHDIRQANLAFWQDYFRIIRGEKEGFPVHWFITAYVWMPMEPCLYAVSTNR